MVLTLVLWLAMAGFGAAQLALDEDIFSLLPQDDAKVQEARDAMQRFRALELVVVALESDDPHALATAMDATGERLRDVEGVKTARWKVDSNDQERIGLLYADKLPELFDEPMQAEVSSRVNDEHFQRRLQTWLDRQAGSEGIDVVDTFRSDPFGLDEIVFRRFENLNQGFQGSIDGGRLVSRDGRVGLIFVEADFSAADTARGQTFMADIGDVLRDQPDGVTPHVIGAHRSSVDNAEVLRTDLHLTIATSVVAIALLFLLAFRSLVPVVVTLLSVGVGFATALGGQGFFEGELSAITLGFSAALLGISVDYSIHLCTTWQMQTGGRLRRARRALRLVVTPAVAAMLTTVVAISTMSFSAFDGLHQLATLATVGMFGALVGALVFGPWILGRFGSKQPKDAVLSGAMQRIEGVRKRFRWLIVGFIVLVLVGAGIGLFRVSFDGDVTHLDGKSQATRDSEIVIQSAFGQETLRRTLIVVDGNDIEQALQRNDRVFEKLVGLGHSPESIAWVLPSVATQKANRKRWQAFWIANHDKALFAMTQAKATHPNDGREIAFTRERAESAFAGFWEKTRKPSGDLLTPNALEDAGLSAVLASSMNQDGNSWHIGTRVALDVTEVNGVRESLDTARVLNKQELTQHMTDLIQHDLLMLGLVSLGLVTLVLVVIFRHPARVVAALVPLLGSLVVTIGVMGWIGLPFNILNTLVTVFIAGLGIDYGIFVVQLHLKVGDAEHAGAGVLVAALTTLFGFGSLALASHPALFSVGISTAIGVVSSLTLTLFLTPTLLEWFSGGKR